MKEKDFTVIFEKYVRIKKLHGVFELKKTDTDSILFSSVKDHQLESLIAVQESGFMWKISDADPRRKPFDLIATPRLVGYVVIKYNKITCIIPVNNFIFERDKSKRKSLTVERAKEISTYILASK